MNDAEVIILRAKGTSLIGAPTSTVSSNLHTFDVGAQIDLLSAFHFGARKSTRQFVLPILPGVALPPNSRIQSQLQCLMDQPQLGLSIFGNYVQPNISTDFLASDCLPIEINDFTLPEIYADILMLCPLFRKSCVLQSRLFASTRDNHASVDFFKMITIKNYQIDPQDLQILNKEMLAAFLSAVYCDSFFIARKWLNKILTLSPNFFDDPEIFIDSTFEFLNQTSTTNPEEYIDKLLAAFPTEVKGDDHKHAQIVASLNAGFAWQNYRHGRTKLACKEIATSILYKPSQLTNRGVVSLFIKSRVNHQYSGSQCLPDELIEDIEAKINEPVIKTQKSVSGINSRVYFIYTQEQQYILRLTNTANLRYYKHVMQLIKQHDVPVPTIIAWSEKVGRAFWEEWVLEEFIAGHAYFHSQLTWQQNQIILCEIGAALRALHTIDLTALDSIPVQFFISPETWLPDRFFECFGQSQLSHAIQARINSAYTVLNDACNFIPALCHLDLSPTNILIKDGHLVSIIDWENAHGSDPILDLAYFHYWHADKDILSQLLENYAPQRQKDLKYLVENAMVYVAARMMVMAERTQNVNSNLICERSLPYLV
ncbi:MAG: aminoglycoside phosphotransferase family protein [Anaerolineaceae bacterium]|nr:aminoglycoside phosphotransferase family protein [Anaerolineaceae bacterium]